MNTLGSRIKHFRSKKDLSQRALAKACGWDSQSRVGNYEVDTREPTIGDIKLMAKHLDVTILDLILSEQELNQIVAEVNARNGNLAPEPDRSPVKLRAEVSHLRRVESNAELAGAPIIWDADTPLDDDEVALPLFDIGIAAGTGSAEVVEIPSMMLRFDKSTLRAASVQADQAACATVRGTSMEPLILDRSVIGIDKRATKIVDGEIYAFAQDGELRVKYLFNLPGGGLRIHSENEAEYPDEVLSAKKAKELRILGWVFWWSTVRRRRGPSLAK